MCGMILKSCKKSVSNGKPRRQVILTEDHVTEIVLENDLTVFDKGKEWNQLI